MSQNCCLVSTLRTLHRLAGGQAQSDLLLWLLKQPDGRMWGATTRDVGKALRLSHTWVRKVVADLVAAGLIENRERVESSGNRLETDRKVISRKLYLKVCFDKLYSEISKGSSLETGWKHLETRSPCDIGVVIPIVQENANFSTTFGQQTAKPKRAKKAPVHEAKSAAVVAAYFDAYEAKYGRRPVRSARINSLACKLVDEIGADIAPAVASFYLSHNNRWYVDKGHQLEWAVKDAQKLRIEYLAGAKITSTMARSADRSQTQDQNFELYMRQREETAAQG